MNDRPIQVAEYEKLPEFFNPIDYDPVEWVKLARLAGMKYITITTRHHDGFSMFDSAVSDYDIVDRTPYQRDIVKPLADECRRQGLKLFFYYSLLDWRHPDYFPRGGTGKNLGRPEAGNWPAYLDFMEAQLRELLTGYGEIGGIWFDGYWDRPDADWQFERIYRLIHSLQPQALIGNNHHREPFDGEDFQMWERDLPGQNTAGYSAGQQIARLPLETCDTINASWGFNITDNQYKTTRQLLHLLARAAAADANLLLNVGPMPNGKIQLEFASRLLEIGEWLKLHGESIYETRGGPTEPQPWGVTTQKPSVVYLHILESEVNSADSASNLRLEISATTDFKPSEFSSARMLRCGTVLDTEIQEDRLTISIPKVKLDPISTVVKLTR